MKNRSTIWAALALGTVLGAAAASLIPHAAAAPTAPEATASVNARLDALESQVKQLKAEVSVLDVRVAQVTGSGNLGVNVLPYQIPNQPPQGLSNIPPSQIILLKTPKK